MPIGAQMQVEGTLELGSFCYVVRNGTGGTQIGFPRGASRLVGGQVEVEGWRIAIDEIACDRLWQRGEPKPQEWNWPGMEPILVGAVMVYGLVVSLASLTG